MEDFTKEMMLNDNDLVNEICCCDGSKLVLSERVKRSRHLEICTYRKEIDRRIQMLKEQSG
jgi:hypothetical protein